MIVYHFYATATDPNNKHYSHEMDGVVMRHEPFSGMKDYDSVREGIRKEFDVPATATLIIKSLSLIGENDDEPTG